MNAAAPKNVTGLTAAEAFARVAKTAPTLVDTSAEERIAKIQRMVKAVMDHLPEIREVVKEELNISQTDIDAQIMMIKTEAEFVCRHLPQWLKDQPVQGSMMSMGKKCYIRYEPKGVVAILATWNAPYACVFVTGVGAIAGGNAVVAKPSELAPKSSALIAKIAAAGCDPDEFQVVEGGAEAAIELLEQPINHCFYIGSHNVGKLVAKACAEHYASYTLEMGGKNPAVVDATADLAGAAQKLSWGRMGNGGQMCVSPDYIMVEDTVVDEFTEAVKAALTKMYNPEGAGFEVSDELGRIINQRHWTRIKGLLDDAIAKGAEVVYGGGSDESDCYFEPTVLRGVTNDMDISQEEIFGPIMVIQSYSDREEIAEAVRSLPKPLSSYIFSKDRAAIEWFLRHTTSGNSVVNHNVIQSGTNPHLPFGGVNASGTGRIGGFATFAETTNPRSVVEDGPPLMDPDLFFPPYQDKYKKMIDDMLNKSFHMPDVAINAINKIVDVRVKVTSLFVKEES